MAEVIKYGVPRGLRRSIAGEGLQALALCCVHDDDPGSRGVDRHAARRELLVGSGHPAWSAPTLAHHRQQASVGRRATRVLFRRVAASLALLARLSEGDDHGGVVGRPLHRVPPVHVGGDGTEAVSLVVDPIDSPAF